MFEYIAEVWFLNRYLIVQIFLLKQHNDNELEVKFVQ